MSAQRSLIPDDLDPTRLELEDFVQPLLTRLILGCY